MLFLGSLAWCLYLLIFLKFWLSFLGLFQLLLFWNESFCLLLGEKSFPSLWNPGFIVLFESAVTLSRCNIIDVYVRYFVHHGFYEFAAVISPVSHDFRLSGLLVTFDCMVYIILKGFDPKVYPSLFCMTAYLQCTQVGSLQNLLMQTSFSILMG